MLTAQVIAEQEFAKEEGYVNPFSEIYNPILVYDRACAEYHWTIKDCDEMHYITFFAMLREASERHRQEQAAYNQVK